MPVDAANLPLLIAGIDALDSGITVFDAALRLVTANRRFSEIIGIPREVLTPGTSIASLFRYNAEHGEYGPGDVETQVAERVAVARRFEAHRFERERPDGRIVEIRGTPLPGGGFVTIYTDVTVERRREQALDKLRAELEQRVAERTAELANKTAQLELVVDHIRHGISLFNGQLQLELCNAQFLEIMRLPSEFGTPGRSFADLIRYNAERGEYGPGDPAAQVAMRVERARKPVPHRFERTRPDGTIIEVIGTPTPDGGFVTTYLDITERKRTEAALQATEMRFRDFANAASDWFFETDEHLRYTWFSEQMQERIGIAPARAIGKRREELADPAVIAAEPERWREHLADLEAHQPYRDFTYRLRDNTGQWRDFSVSGIPAFDGDGRFIGYRGTGADITAIKSAERALRDSEALLRTILEAGPVGVALLARADLRMLACNARLAERLRQPIDALLGQPVCPAFRAALASLPLDAVVEDREIEISREDGASWWALLSTRPLDFRGEAALLVWVYDVSELHEARESVQHLAQHDPLTDIPNRRYLQQFADQALARAQRNATRGALVYLDLDGFKAVNDKLGHQQGDVLLRAIARAIRARVRRTDFVARLGGDEFAVVIENMPNDADPVDLAHEIIAIVGDTAARTLPDSDLAVAASAGIAYFDANGPDFDTLIGRADAAMYRAKLAGRATVCIAADDA